MNGPCLCGDPACQSCFPGNNTAEVEAAWDYVNDVLGNLSPREIILAVGIGLEAVKQMRSYVDEQRKAALAIEAENRMYEEPYR